MTYDERVQAYEAEGMTRSDAQGIVDLEDLRAARKGDTMSTHTPGPWKVKPYLTPELDEDPMMVYEVIAGDLQERFDNLPVDENEEQALHDIHAENAANAAFIARACNSHEAMLEALKQAVTYIPQEGDEDLDVYETCIEAIRLAEGKVTR